MQQYRFNFPLFIGLVVGALVCTAAVYGLWRFQIERKSDWLITEAEKAREAGEFRSAANYYRQYLTIHPDDLDNRIHMAKVSAEQVKSDDVEPGDFASAVQALESTLRSSGMDGHPESKTLRRELVDLYGLANRYSDALEHINYLLQSNPGDPDFQALRATYLARAGSVDEAVRLSYKLVGYDPAAEEFDAEKATAAGDTELHSNLAFILRTKQDKPELADRVMDQLVAANPNSAEAHLARGRWLLSVDNADEGRAEIEEAYRLKPDDADVLLSIAEVSAKDEQYDKAAEYVGKGKELFPKDVRFYSMAAGIQMRQEQFEKAMEEINAGLEKVAANDKIHLMIYKTELQLGKRDFKGAEQSVGDMQRLSTNIRPEFVDYYKARIMVEQGEWPQAKTAFSKLRPRMAELGPGRVADVDFYLGFCYEKLGQRDLAIDSYEAVLQQNPENAPAKAAVERMRLAQGLRPTDAKDDPMAKIFEEEMKKPKDQRDFKKLDALLEQIGAEQEWDELTALIRKAQLKTMSEDYAGARQLLTQAQKIAPENIGLRRMVIQLAVRDPKVGPEKALQVWNQTVKEVGDLPALRLDKADILIAMHAGKDKEELKAELATLFSDIDSWSTAQKTELWTGMAGRYLNQGMVDEARQYLTLAADALPNELQLRQQLFALALDANDDAGMKDAQDEILKVVGRGDSAWLYTEARRQLSLVRRGQLDPKAIDQIRILVNRALDQRPEWHELHVLNGELELQAGKLAKALEHFDRAQELGRPYPAATAQHIKLLALSGRMKEAGELLDRIPEAVRYSLLGQLYPEILFRTNRVDEALEQARAAIDANPQNPQSHYWYSQLLARSAFAAAAGDPPSGGQGQSPATGDRQPDKKKMEQAIQSMRKAVEIQPEFPDAWLALINYFSQLKDMEQARAILREAQLALSGDNLQVFLARGYQALGSWFDAETMYRAVYNMAPDELARAQQLAAFYLGGVYPLPDKNLKATPLINKILRAGAENKLQPNDPTLLWARRVGAKMLAETGDYQNLLKAEKLLASNSQDGVLTIEDKLAMAEILAGRPEPVSRKKAIQLLEEVSEVQRLSEIGEITLGHLYYATNQEDWRRYQTHMEKTIGLFPNSLNARAAYARTLIQRGDRSSLETATRHVGRMREIDPRHVATFELTVRLADKLDRQEAAAKYLMDAVPDLSKVASISNVDAQRLSMLANLFVELDDLDNAERIYREMARIDPNRIPALAAFLGEHRSVEQAFEKLNEVYAPERIPPIVQVALVVVRKQREKVGDKFDAQIQQWLDTGLRENPNSITLLMDQADFYDIQKRYTDAAAVYSDLLKRSDLTGIRRAIVLNNLAFLVALAGPSAKVDADPLKLVEESKDIMGPNSDILDTRAVVHISRKQYQEAIEDLELSVTDNPTASKYFHKAQAHLLAGQNRAAVEAWEKAEELGLDHDAVNLMEVELLDNLKAKIEQIRGNSVTQADGLRRAG